MSWAGLCPARGSILPGPVVLDYVHTGQRDQKTTEPQNLNY
jgi:hypothetical protein